MKASIMFGSKKLFVFLQVCATLGTTGVCAFDNLEEIGEVCKYQRTNQIS